MKKFLIISAMFLTGSLVAQRTDVATVDITDAVNGESNVGISASSSGTFTFSPGDSLVYSVDVPSFIPDGEIDSDADSALFFIRVNCKMITTEGEFSITSTVDKDASVYAVSNATSINVWPKDTTKSDSTILLEGTTQNVYLVNTGSVDIQINYITFLTSKVSLISNSNKGLLSGLGVKTAPNPVVDFLKIDLPSDINSLELSLKSLDGVLHKSFTVTKSNKEIDLSDLNAGMYLLINDKSSFFQKIMIK